MKGSENATYYMVNKSQKSEIILDCQNGKEICPRTKIEHNSIELQKLKMNISNVFLEQCNCFLHKSKMQTN